MLQFTGERIVPGAANCEPSFARKMYQEHVLRYAFAAQFAEGADILDVGCGVGYGSRLLAERRAKSVLAIDIAADAIEHARCEYTHPSITFERRSVYSLAEEDAFDLVTCFEMIEHVDDQALVIANVARALRPGGVLAISTPRPLATKRSAFHVRELPPNDFIALLNQHFASVVTFAQNNYFTSVIGTEVPARIDKIMSITNQFGIDQSDYVVILATTAEDCRFDDLAPMMVMNDADYIATLEHDVGILRTAEDDLKAQLADLRAEHAAIIDALDTVRPQRDSATMALAKSEAEAGRLGRELSTVKLLHSTALATATAAQTALLERNDVLNALKDRAERAEALHRHELGEAQNLHAVLAQHSVALGKALEEEERLKTLHAHELGQARMLHRALQQTTDELEAMHARVGQAEALHAHELGEARNLHSALASCDRKRCEAEERAAEAVEGCQRLQIENAALAAEIERLLDQSARVSDVRRSKLSAWVSRGSHR